MLTLVFILVFLIGFIFRMQMFDINYKPSKYNVITSDGIGYYSYLPSTFISKNKQTSSNPDHYMVFDGNPKTKHNKYFVGTSILMVPFFCVAHLYTSTIYKLNPNTRFKPNGYSFPYHISICIAGVFYLALGMFIIKKLSVNLGIKQGIVFFLIVVFSLGTQLTTLSSYEASFSHIYAFFTISLILYLINNFSKTPNIKIFLYIVSLLTLLVLIRPTDILIALTFPIFLYLNNTNKSLYWLKKQRLAYVYAIMIILFMLSIQLVYWKLQKGEFFVWSYSGEGFDFSKPEFFNVLFSYKKGLFIYTPILIPTFVYIIVSKINVRKKIWFFLFFIANTYVISSWWCWWYGGSYGMRPWIDFLPIIILLLALSLNKINKKYRYLFYTISILSIPINIIQTYQYSCGIMHWDQMNKDKYWQIFLETKNDFDFITYDPPKNYQNYTVIDSTHIIIEKTKNVISNVEKDNMYYTLYETHSDSIFSYDSGTYAKVKFKGKVEFMRKNAVLTCNKNLTNSKNVIQEAKRVIAYIRKSGKWLDAEMFFDLGNKRNNEEEFIIFFYNNQRNKFWFKNVEITFYNYILPKN